MMVDLVSRIASAVDPKEPTPLYHQVAAIIRWEIEQGRVSIGSLLPPIRRLAAATGINYHTVRRGYDELEGEGVVRSRRGVGVRVLRAPTATHWTPAAAGAGDRATTPPCWVVAQSLGGAADLGGSLGERWRVAVGALAWDPAAPPPGGPILAPTPLRDAIVAAWPGREADLHPIDLVLEGATLAVIRRNVALLGSGGVRLHGAGEQDLRELRAQLPRVGITIQPTDPDREVAPDGSVLEVVTAEVWQGLPWELRQHPGVLRLDWRFAPGALAGVARALEWGER